MIERTNHADNAHRTRALITGASSGIGAALARRMASRGIEVWLAARREERLAAEVTAIERAGGRAHALPLDVRDAAGTAATVQRLDAEVGGLDVIVANAGIGGGGHTPARATWEDAQAVFATNVVGALATLLSPLPRMLERATTAGRRGHLVAISSLAAELPLPSAPLYGASKAALTFFLEGAQGELPRRGIDVTIVHPGFVKSELTAKNKFRMPFLLETEDAARIIDDGIQRRARRVRFPLGLVGLIGLGKVLPRGVKDSLVRGRNR